MNELDSFRDLLEQEADENSSDEEDEGREDTTVINMTDSEAEMRYGDSEDNMKSVMILQPRHSKRWHPGPKWVQFKGQADPKLCEKGKAYKWDGKNLTEYSKTEYVSFD